MKSLKIAALSVLIVAFAFSPAFAGGGGATTGGATEWTQVMQYIEQLKYGAQTLSQGAKKLEKAMNHYERMRAQATGLKQSVMDRIINEDIAELLQIIRTGQRANRLIQGMSSEWANIKRGLIDGRDIDLQSIIDQYARWDDTNETLIKEALKKHDIQYDEFTTEKEILDGLKRTAKTAKTRTQLLQTASMISLEQVKQLRKLRALMLSQIEMENYYRQVEQQKKEMKRRLSEKLYDFKLFPTDSPGYNADNMF